MPQPPPQLTSNCPTSSIYEGMSRKLSLLSYMKPPYRQVSHINRRKARSLSDPRALTHSSYPYLMSRMYSSLSIIFNRSAESINIISVKCESPQSQIKNASNVQASSYSSRICHGTKLPLLSSGSQSYIQNLADTQLNINDSQSIPINYSTKLPNSHSHNANPRRANSFSTPVTSEHLVLSPLTSIMARMHSSSSVTCNRSVETISSIFPMCESPQCPIKNPLNMQSRLCTSRINSPITGFDESLLNNIDSQSVSITEFETLNVGCLQKQDEAIPYKLSGSQSVVETSLEDDCYIEISKSSLMEKEHLKMTSLLSKYKKSEQLLLEAESRIKELETLLDQAQPLSQKAAARAELETETIAHLNEMNKI